MGKGAINAVSVVLAIALVASILFTLLLAADVSVQPPERVVVRKVDVALPPPPPPPEPRRQTEPLDPDLSINLTGDHGGPQIEFSAKPQLADVTINRLPEPDLDRYKMDIDASISRSIRSYRVEELDDVPRIVRSRQSRIPATLRNQGVRSVRVEVDIIIDVHGEAHVRRIVDAGYPQMVPVVREHIDAVQFTVPRKNGQPVNGEYLFIINFKEVL